MPRVNKPSGKSRHDPLLVQLDDDELEAKYGRVSKPGKRKKSKQRLADDEENGDVSSPTHLKYMDTQCRSR
jgi:essential nuclear protein 1